MKTWDITTVTNTCSLIKENAIQQKNKNAPVYVKVIMNDGDSVVYPISSIGTNGESVLISVYDKDMKNQDQIKELRNEEKLWIERTSIKKRKG